MTPIEGVIVLVVGLLALVMTSKARGLAPFS